MNKIKASEQPDGRYSLRPEFFSLVGRMGVRLRFCRKLTFRYQDETSSNYARIPDRPGGVSAVR